MKCGNNKEFKKAADVSGGCQQNPTPKVSAMVNIKMGCGPMSDWNAKPSDTT